MQFSMMRLQFVFSGALLLVVSPCSGLAQKDALAALPPMGWNSWNHFKDKVDDASVRAAAEAMVSSGIRDASYVYVNIDDTWEGERDAQGRIQANSKFPDMKALADFVHSKGLKLDLFFSGSFDVREVCGQFGT